MRASTHVRPLLARHALAAVKCREDDYFAKMHGAIKARRGHKKAIIAVARMMFSCICHMLPDGETSDPADRDGPAAEDEGKEAVREASEEG